MEKIQMVGPAIKLDIEKICNENIESAEHYKRVVAHKWGLLTILIYEEFYFRINSDLTISVIYDEREDQNTVEIITSGGKLGLAELSYGAEKNAANKIAKALEKFGYKDTK